LAYSGSSDLAVDYIHYNLVMSVTDDLLIWFDRYGRQLPWRERSDPYAIWVSEVMLQQTRVQTALPYFEAFMRRFPTIEALAAARLEEVLKVWEGMGYYARARNLYRAAGIVIKEHASGLPADRKRLRQLPGIGDYTADALAAIAFGQDVLALEGNLRRVLARLFDLHLDPRTPEGERALRELGEPLLPRGQASAFNQALMDLGAMICTPRNPDCGRCPIQGHCLAFHRGTQRDLPVRAPRKVLPTLMPTD
jgi:A/G-specific adenine glycosylase